MDFVGVFDVVVEAAIVDDVFGALVLVWQVVVQQRLIDQGGCSIVII